MSKNFGMDATEKDRNSGSNPSLDSDASQLIDNLFAQLEEQLQESQSAGTQNAAPSSDLHSTQALSALNESAELEVSYSPIEPAAIETYPVPWQPSLDDTIGIGNPQESQFGQRLFFGLAGTCLGAAALWMVTQVTVRQAEPVATAPTENIQASPADVQFSTKIKRSLQQIDSTPSPQTAIPTPATPEQTAGQPSSAANQSGLHSLRAAQAAAPKLPNQTLSTIPTTPNSTKFPTQKKPLPKLLPVQPAPPVRPRPQPSAPLQTQLPNLQPNLQATAPQRPPTLPNQPVQPVPLTTVSQASQTLVGVMELGEQSVALVANNGATRQVKLGEVLNENGWVLTGVSNGQAIIKRGGQVRTLDPKQKF